jgi:hypothetical protein
VLCVIYVYIQINMIIKFIYFFQAWRAAYDVFIFTPLRVYPYTIVRRAHESYLF